ncbi:MAG: zf-HC2 domain-containing protein [Myxococcota bacterium]
MISHLIHRHARRKVSRLLGGSLSPRRHRRLRAHLGGCPSCRAYYEGERLLEDALFAPATLNPAAIERLADLVIEPAPKARRHWLPFAVLALGGAAAMLAVTLRPPTTIDEAMQARGVATAPAAAALVLFAIDPQSESVARLSRDAQPITLARGSTVQLAYRNESYRFAAVLGIRADGEIQWYHPAEAQALTTGGVALVSKATDEPFGNAWTITAPTGSLRLLAFFADAPLTATALEAEARRVGLHGVATVPGAVVDSLALEIVR